ncbi:MAG: hypothetical protein FD177_923 [Desulfovibrionaceae bacterium]|nr:MAG: hypothetical protein FD177_923 [Desulfovibrionaceae bacterium]
MPLPNNFDARVAKLTRDLARMELDARLEERADVESDFYFAQARNDRAALDALRPKLAEFSALEARAYGPEPAAEFTAQDAEKAADEILREHGLIDPQCHTPPLGGYGALREPDHGTPHSRTVAVNAGDAAQVVPSGFSQADADAEAERLLLEFGITPKPSAGF